MFISGNNCIATVDIKRGEEITTNYQHLHLPNSIRRKNLKENWYFDCACIRCQDPTELGTNLDAIKCKICEREENGESFLLPKDSLDFSTSWTCSSGVESHSKTKAECVKLTETLLSEKDLLDRSNMEKFLNFYDRVSHYLHDNHYVLTSVRRWMLPLFCRRSAANPKGNQSINQSIKLSIKIWYMYSLNEILRYCHWRNAQKKDFDGKKIFGCFGHCWGWIHQKQR